MNKKISLAALALIFSLASTQALALNLDKLAKAVDDSHKNGNGKNGGSVLDGALGNVTDKLNKKVDEITEKLDKYEEKIEKAEKATDKIVKLVEDFSVEKYVRMIKVALFVLAGAFTFFGVMLLLVYLQLAKVKKKLMSAAIKF